MSRIFLPMGLLLLGLAAYFALVTETSNPVSRGNLVPQNASSTAEEERGGAAAEGGSETAVADDLSPCVSIEEFVAGPDGYRLDSWFMSWGAPPIGDTPNPASSYSWYDDETLLEMGQAGDAVAKHERGRRLIISALTGVRSPPKESTIWDVAVDSPELPLDQNIDSRKLNTGREVLFDAAVLGRTYALIEIAISYALERQALSAADKLNSDARAELRVMSFAFGESAERLVPALHSSFFQSSLPSELRPAATRELDEISGRVLNERSELGITSQQIDEETARIFDSLRICQD